eukprot:4316105-Amphidinium_carterae.1
MLRHLRSMGFEFRQKWGAVKSQRTEVTVTSTLRALQSDFKPQARLGVTVNWRLQDRHRSWVGKSGSAEHIRLRRSVETPMPLCECDSTIGQPSWLWPSCVTGIKG